MKYLLIFLLVVAVCSACDVRSGTAKREMEKWEVKPTPTFPSTPTPTPVDPVDIVQADTSLDGETLTVNGEIPKQTVECNRFQRVMINGGKVGVTIKGVCRQIMVNGDGNDITANAATEYVLNGTGNTLRYSRYVNGKVPLIKENQAGNIIEKVPFQVSLRGETKK